MKWLKQRQRDKRGLEIQHLVPDMLQYVSERYIPPVQYSVSSEIKYSFSSIPEDETDIITDMAKFAREAEMDRGLYDSPALKKTYHAWEKKNAEYRSFSSEVTRMVKEKYRKPSEFYRAAGIDKRTWHKISSDFGYRPSRMTAFRCCIGLKLNMDEAESLLKLAGMAFSPNDPDDLVLEFCLENGIRDIPGINYMLYKYATRPLEESVDQGETGDVSASSFSQNS